MDRFHSSLFIYFLVQNRLPGLLLFSLIYIKGFFLPIVDRHALHSTYYTKRGSDWYNCPWPVFVRGRDSETFTRSRSALIIFDIMCLMVAGQLVKTESHKTRLFASLTGAGGMISFTDS